MNSVVREVMVCSTPNCGHRGVRITASTILTRVCSHSG